MMRWIVLLTAFGLVACSQPKPKVISFEEAKAYCEEERRKTAGPTGKVNLGVSSESGVFGGVSLSVTDKFIRGLDPNVVYERCMERAQQYNQAQVEKLNARTRSR